MTDVSRPRLRGEPLADERMEAAAMFLARPDGHAAHCDGQFACQWPEADIEFGNSHCTTFIGGGCRGCLIAMAMAHRSCPEDAYLEVDGAFYTGARAVAVGDRAIELAASSSVARMERCTPEEFGALL